MRMLGLTLLANASVGHVKSEMWVEMPLSRCNVCSYLVAGSVTGRYQWSYYLQKEEPGEDPEVDEGKL
ncbi:unnamed protein product [Clonostachys byssicola]|uniref:Uncharacterized protein n=1 Tax=Clonostachys byssicola TaxID=160290 RepID=A0A9N9U3S6_9HYPO|nr:unnamed protein product [Clonostachys byssicola]